MAKYVQKSKDIINIREVTDPNKSEEDGCELVHGFFGKRPVFDGKQSSSEQFQCHHQSLDTDTYRNI